MLVLGGTSGIGAAIAERMVAEGTKNVGLAVRDPQSQLAIETATALGNQGADVQVIAWNANDRTDLVPVIVDGAWDAVVVACGQLGDQEALLADLGEAAQLMTLNFTDTAFAALSAAEGLRQRGQGVLVVLSSVAAVRARAANFVYAATKSGLDAIARGLADQLHGSGVRVITVRPGFVRTRMTEGLEDQPFATDAPAVAADVFAAVMSRKSAVIYSPAVLRGVYAGLRALPSALWRRISA